MSSKSMTEDVDTDLSDEQIDALLNRAEARLQASEDKIYTRPVAAQSLAKPQVISRHEDSRNQERTQKTTGMDVQHLANGIRRVEDPISKKKRQLEEKQANAGSKWFNLPKTDVTPQLRRDLQIIHMRNVLDPHRHYKKQGGKLKVPEFSQVGTLKEGPTEFYSTRLTNKERKQTLVEQVLSGERDSGKYKSKYNAIQERKKSGKKGHFKAKMRERYGDRYNG